MTKKGTILLPGVEVARAAYNAGFRDAALVTAVAVSKAESSWWQDSVSASDDWGLWQINRAAHGSQYDFNRLLADPNYNAKAAWDISGHGKNWTPWSTYSPDFSQAKAGTGPYRLYISDATTAVNTLLKSSGVQIPMQLISSTRPAPTATPASSGGGWNMPVIVPSSERQKPFDNRHRRVGTRSKLFDIFQGPMYTGVIHPLSTNPNVSGPSRGGTVQVPYGSQRGARGEGGGPSASMGVGESPNALFFEFNPNEIGMTYSGNASVLPLGSLDPSQTNPAVPMADSNTVISFDLYFDRSYEVFGGDRLGVLTDIRTLERITGITPDQPVMLQNPVNIHLGEDSSFQFKAIISQWSVNYVQFSQRMIPMRATVSIAATRLSSKVFATADEVTQYSADDWRTKVGKPPGPAVSPEDAAGMGITPDLYTWGAGGA